MPALAVDQFAIEKQGYASRPWRIVHTPSGKTVTIPHALVNGDGKTVAYRGPACFSRKRDAVEWMSTVLPHLLDVFNGGAA